MVMKLMALANEDHNKLANQSKHLKQKLHKLNTKHAEGNLT